MPSASQEDAGLLLDAVHEAAEFLETPATAESDEIVLQSTRVVMQGVSEEVFEVVVRGALEEEQGGAELQVAAEWSRRCMRQGLRERKSLRR